MATIVLNPGEKVDIQFAESDGNITVEFGADALRVTTDLPDTSGRDGVIYEEVFGAGIPDVAVAPQEQ